MKRIRTLSLIAMVVMLPILIYYPYEGLAWNLELSFLDMGKWKRNSNWVHPEAQIAMTTRIVFFTLWALPYVVGWFRYASGFWALMLLRQGIVFDDRIANRLTWMGILGFISAVSALFAGAASPMVRSWHNPDGPLPLRFWYDSGNIGLGFSALAFLFLGLVMREAIKIARENEEFV